MEEPAEGLIGGGAEGDWEVEEPMEGPASRTSLPTGDAAGRYRTSYPLQM